MKQRILLVGNKPLVREQLCKKLEMQDYDVGWAADGQDALQNVDFQQTDLLLIDLDTPPADSLGILSRITEANPVLLVVGLTELTNLPVAAFGSWISAVVEKPVDVADLIRVVEELLAQVPEDHGRGPLVPRRALNVQDDVRRWSAEPNICPAPYSGWGINE